MLAGVFDARRRPVPMQRNGKMGSLVADHPDCESIAFQTGHTKRNGRGWDDWEVSYTLNLATDFAVCVIRGIGK